MVRKIEEKIHEFCSQNSKKALLITGARQIGKTYAIRKVGKTYDSFVELNFYENEAAREAFDSAKTSEELLLRMSALLGKKLVPGKTIVFLDEVQECKEIVTAVKFLVEEGSYRYILSGSLLGVELKDIRSMPVGYMDVEEMYPMDFQEFIQANGVADGVVENLRNAFVTKEPVDEIVHEKLMELFHLYLVVGGMPRPVAKYLETYNLNDVIKEQRAIIRMYKKDISRYDPKEKLLLEDIFDLIPSELNSKNKRFILKDLNENFKFNRYSNSFLWLKDAGVALPAFCASEPTVPLMLSKSTNLFKLFLADVGLLAAMYAKGIQLNILNRDADINYGAIYENAVAQELTAHEFDLYYFNSKKQGELDFLVEREGKALPIEVKSGKAYTKHAALTNVMANEAYGIQEAFVFYNGNVALKENVVYLPIYMTMFLEKERELEDIIYKIDLSLLQ